MLVRDARARQIAGEMLGDKSVVLMRGHGDVTVGPSVKVAVFRAYYTDIDAKLQSQAIALGGGDINFLTPEEGAKADTVNLAVSTASGICGSCVSRRRCEIARRSGRRDNAAECRR